MRAAILHAILTVVKKKDKMHFRKHQKFNLLYYAVIGMLILEIVFFYILTNNLK